MAEIVTDLGAGTTYLSFVEQEEEETTGVHVHSEFADDDHEHADITSFDVASGSATPAQLLQTL